MSYRVLIFTGLQAYPLLNRILNKQKDRDLSSLILRIERINVSVAAFITPRRIIEKKTVIENFNPDMILVPGLCKKDFSIVEEKTGYVTRKGTESVGQLPDLLSQLGSIKYILSAEKSADRFLGMKYREETEKILMDRQNDTDLLLSEMNIETRNGFKIGTSFPVRVFAEIVDATLKSEEEVEKEALYYKSKGADVIDFGCVLSHKDPVTVENRITQIRQITDLPVSIDSMDPSEIKAGMNAGAEFIVSIDRGNQDVLIDLHGDPCLILLPTNIKHGIFPESPIQRVELLLELEKDVRAEGFTKILIDPILEAPIMPGFCNSLQGFYLFREYSSTPLFAGTGNVTEFLEADSSGVNALLAVISQELGIAGVLTTEESAFTSNSVSELSNSSWMVYSADINQRVPKKLGNNALFCKTTEKNNKTIDRPVDLEIVDDGSISHKICMDPMGCFKIQVDKFSQLIYLHHVKGEEVVKTYASQKSLPLLKIVANESLVSDFFHAAYIGKELMKAEVCLKTGRTYMQDKAFDTATDRQ